MIEFPIPKHFPEMSHTVSQLRFRVIDYVPPLRRRGHRHVMLKKKELMWIRRLVSLSILGLNRIYACILNYVITWISSLIFLIL